MSDINSVVLTGRTTSDIEVSQTPSGKSVATFIIAVDGRKKENTDFIRIQAWGNLADNAAKYLGKGSKIGVEGRLSVHHYEKDGFKRTSYSVIAENISWENIRKLGQADDSRAEAETEEAPVVDSSETDDFFTHDKVAVIYGDGLPF